MSATLTWYNYGLATKTGTTAIDAINDMETLVNSKSADPNFKWQVAGKNVGASPQWILFSRKSGSAGRIALIHYASAPAANHASLFQQVPGTGVMQGAWFPNGNVNTLSNLTAASGTICGNDTGLPKAAPFGVISTTYAALFQPFILDSDEIMGFFFTNPAGLPTYGGFIGDCTVDGSDNAVGAVVGFGTSNINQFGAAAMPGWTTTATVAGSNNGCIQTNHSTLSGYPFFVANTPGAWANGSPATPVLFNGTSNQVEIPPVSLRPTATPAGVWPTNLPGFPLKLRQIGYGPATTSQFFVYNLTGPIVNARCVCAATTGGQGYPWVVNQKN